ncbi:MAG: response regulator transcription factor [Planctomycetaceae bacterium]|nr:response regulator transcription factor [Planctomycetaceae bacterium]
MPEIRLFIADDHVILRSGLRMLISTQSDMTVVGEAGDFETTRKLVREMHPDVLILDLSMPGGNVRDQIEELTRSFPETRVLILTMHDDVAMFRMAVAAGAAGYIVKSAADEELLTAIRKISSGGTWINLPGSKTDAQPALTETPESKGLLETLSAREREVLILVSQGHTNQAIAKQLFLSVKTVESYRSRLMNKLNLGSRAELTQFAIKHGMLNSPQ